MKLALTSMHSLTHALTSLHNLPPSGTAQLQCVPGNSSEPGEIHSPDCAGSACYTPAAQQRRAKASPGTVFLAVFVTVVASYCVIGAAIQAKRGARYRELVPNSEFWANVVALIGIGCAFTFRKAKSVSSHVTAHSRYENL
jgi:hypothetical protein